MRDSFDWQFGESGDKEPSTTENGRSRTLVSAFWFLAVTAVFTAALLITWQIGRRQLARTEADLQQEVQALLDLEQEAVRAGDGDLFFSLLADDAAWRAAQLRPANQTPIRAGLTATRTTLRDDYIWASVTWHQERQPYQRVAFFRQVEGRLVHVPSAPGYWGEQRWVERSWGRLVTYQVDQPWAEAVGNVVERLVADICTTGCVADRLPFTLVLTSDYAETAVPHTIHVPSPRLLALDTDGLPAAPFWGELRRHLVAHLTPAHIRFALPPPVIPGVYRMDYHRAAANFMAANPHITVELVPLETIPADPAALAQFDGVAVPPTAAMVAAGLVYDLTDLAYSDPEFYPQDLYATAWRGAVWRDRLWFVPHLAWFRLLFYDKMAYQTADRLEPAWQWRWTDMEADMAALVAAQPTGTHMTWGFLDIHRDALYAYAFNQNRTCRETAVSSCADQLQSADIAAALAWHGHMVRTGQTPDLTGLTAEERAWRLTNYQAARRRAAIWVDDPVQYEYQQLTHPVGAAPFPGLGIAPGVTPLWVEGGFISASSEQPLAVWQWLTYLSFQPPVARYRQVPARPSVAVDTNYWFSLPRPLVNAMRTAFNNARPVTLPERPLFADEQLGAVIAGEAPQTVAQKKPRWPWFAASQ